MPAWGVSADAVSYLSVVAAASRAVFFWRWHTHPWFLLAGPLLCYLRLWFNMLDGMVALAARTASRRGEILNDLPDRVSDVLIFAGVAHSGWCRPALGYWAAIFALLTAYVGTLGQAVAGRREYGGIMAKPWRMVTLHIGAWLTSGLLQCGISLHWAALTVLDWTCEAVILGCLQHHRRSPGQYPATASRRSEERGVAFSISPATVRRTTVQFMQGVATLHLSRFTHHVSES